jgi:predicted FMN-binding regulatory protein PaiB
MKMTTMKHTSKVSQNRPAADRDGAAEGLRREGQPAASAMADLVRQSKSS